MPFHSLWAVTENIALLLRQECMCLYSFLPFFFPKSLGKYAAAAISIGLIINRIFKKCPDEPAAVNTSKIETPGFKTRAEPGG